MKFEHAINWLFSSVLGTLQTVVMKIDFSWHQHMYDWSHGHLWIKLLAWIYWVKRHKNSGWLFISCYTHYQGVDPVPLFQPWFNRRSEASLRLNFAKFGYCDAKIISIVLRSQSYEHLTSIFMPTNNDPTMVELWITHQFFVYILKFCSRLKEFYFTRTATSNFSRISCSIHKNSQTITHILDFQSSTIKQQLPNHIQQLFRSK